LLSALGVILVCHTSNVFLKVLKVPLSIIDAFAGPGVISNSRTFGRSFGVSQMFFFSGIESSAGFPNITPRTICTGKFIHDVGLSQEMSMQRHNFSQTSSNIASIYH